MIIRSNRAKNEYRKRARYSCCFVLRRSYGRNPYGRNYARLHFQKKKWERHRLTFWKMQGESVAMPDQELDQELREKEKKEKKEQKEKYLPASCSFDSSISGIVRQEVNGEAAKNGDDMEKDDITKNGEAKEDSLENKEVHSDDPALLSAVEAILFAMGDSVQVSAIAKALDKSQEEIQHAADALQRRYDAGGSGLMIQHYDDALQLSTRPEQYQNLIRIAKVPKKVTLSDAVIETLSIIAYRQPITKAEIEQIRGVSSDYAVNRLLEYDLIRELGRKEAPGKPILFGTTEQFLRTFGIQQLSDLPQLPPSAKEEFQEEAEAEIDSRLNV